MALNKFARRPSGGGGGTPHADPADPSPSGFVSRGAPKGAAPTPTPHPLTKPTPQPAEQYTALRTRELADMGIQLTPALGATLLGLSWQHEAAHQARSAAAEADPSDPREFRAAQKHAAAMTAEARKAEAEWWALVRAGR